jgi:O-antigen/teichoic acid export membrane protein
MLKGVLSVAAITTWLWMDGGIIGAAAVLAASWGVLLFLYDLRSSRWLADRDADVDQTDIAPLWQWPVLRRLAWQAFPIGVRVMLFTLCFNIPRYFLERYEGPEALGIFAALAYVTVVGQVLSNALGQAASPRLASHYASGDMAGFRRLTLMLAGAGAVLGAGGVVVAVLFGRPLLTLLYKPEYAEHVGVFAWIMAGAGMWCVASMFVCAANAARRQGSQAAAALVVTIATVTASAVLIRSESLAGAAAASVISAAVGLLVFAAIFLTIGKPDVERTVTP